MPLEVIYDKRLEIFIKRLKENSSVNYEKDNASLVLSKVPVQKCFSKYFLDGLSLMDCGILFQKKHPIMPGQNLLRLVRNEGMKI